MAEQRLSPQRPMRPTRILAPLPLFLLALVAAAAGDDSADVAGAASAASGARLRGASSAQSQLRQVLVFDAGSSGTRVHIFNVHLVLGAHVPEVNQTVRSRQTLKVKPGLSQYAQADDMDGLGASIRQLLEFADNFVEPARRPSTPCLVKATAGLRAIPAEKANKALDRVREALASSSYLSRNEWVEIIPGKEEGGLAWVAANYLAGTFRRSTKTEGSLGVIEMGGGSSQVTFEVSDKSFKLAGSDTFEFATLTGRNFRVYAHSYLGYGQDHAQARVRELEPGTGSAPDVEDPCYPQGFEYHRELKNSTLPGWKVQGVGKSEGCMLKIRDHFFSAPLSSDAPGRYAEEPPLRGRFVATENFYYVRDDLKLPLLGGQKSMEDAAHEVCKKSLREPPQEPPKHCFALSYQAAFLQALRRRPPTQSPPRGSQGGAGFVAAVAAAAADAKAAAQDSIEITRKINGGEVDWALGAALVQVISSERSLAAAAESQQLHGALPGGLAEPSGAALALAAAATAALLLLGVRRLRASTDDTNGKIA